METATYVLLGIAGLLALGLGLRRFVELIGFPCQFCGEKIRTFRRLDAPTQAAILEYFHEHERREPDRSGLFVCMGCRTVHDDFSGEKASWDADAYGCVTFCKACLATIRQCEPGREDIKCPRCSTSYAWSVHPGSEFRFFMPPEGTAIQRRGSSMRIDR